MRISERHARCIQAECFGSASYTAGLAVCSLLGPPCLIRLGGVLRVVASLSLGRIRFRSRFTDLALELIGVRLKARTIFA